MPRALLCGLLMLGGLLWPAVAAAHHFTIELKVQAGKARKAAAAETAAPGAKPKPRAVLRVRAKTPVTVRWTLTNADAEKTYKDVLVHFFTVKVDKLGQATAPRPLVKGVAAESALTMDFKPKDATRGELTFTIDTPGVYLLRLETIGAAVGADGHEHFAAVDLLVE